MTEYLVRLTPEQFELAREIIGNFLQVAEEAEKDEIEYVRENPDTEHYDLSNAQKGVADLKSLIEAYNQEALCWRCNGPKRADWHQLKPDGTPKGVVTSDTGDEPYYHEFEEKHDCQLPERTEGGSYLGGDLKFRGQFGAPGFGNSWECKVCTRAWSQIGTHFFDMEEDPDAHILRPGDVK